MPNLDMESVLKHLNNSSNYWEKRSMLTTLTTMRTEEQYDSLLKRAYRDMERKLQKSLESVYARYAKNNKISNAEAYKILTNKEVMERRMSLQDYIDNAKGNLTPEMRKTLLNESLKHRVTVIEDLSTQWKIIVDEMDYEGSAKDVLNKIYNDSFYRTQYDMKDAGISRSFNQVDVSKVDRLLKEDWGHGSFSDNVWKNKEKLNSALDDILTLGFAQGSDLGKMSAELAHRMNVDYKVALRLVRTESARLQNQGTLDSYKDLGLKKFQFIATLDGVTSDICRHMDMEVFLIEDAKVGLNVPPLHPNCRSALMPYFEDDEINERVMLDPITNKNITTDVRDYEEYLDRVLGKGGSDFTKEREKLKELTKAQDTQYNTTKKWSEVVSSLIHPQPSKITKSQKETVEEFIEDEFNELNDALDFGEDLTDYQKEIMREIDKILLNMEPTLELVSTDLNVPKDQLQDFLSDYTPGNILTFKSYLHANPLQHDPSVQVQFLIQSKSGRKMEAAGYEDLILFSRDSRFHVLHVDSSNIKNILIVLEELL